MIWDRQHRGLPTLAYASGVAQYALGLDRQSPHDVRKPSPAANAPR
jgi:hypothetical protein